MYNFFYDVIFANLNFSCQKVSTTDASWMNDRLKLLIKKRQQAFLLTDLNRLYLNNVEIWSTGSENRVEQNGLNQTLTG